MDLHRIGSRRRPLNRYVVEAAAENISECGSGDRPGIIGALQEWLREGVGSCCVDADTGRTRDHRNRRNVLDINCGIRSIGTTLRIGYYELDVVIARCVISMRWILKVGWTRFSKVPCPGAGACRRKTNEAAGTRLSRCITDIWNSRQTVQSYRHHHRIVVTTVDLQLNKNRSDRITDPVDGN